MRNTHGGSVRRSAAVAALSLLVLAVVGCAAGRASSPARPLRSPPSGPTLVFENAGTEVVKLYLSERGSEWFLGYVPPGRTEVLPLPPSIAASPAGRRLSLLVVTSMAARSPRGASAAPPGVITSETFTSDYLTSMRWKLVGRWVIAAPDAVWP